MEPEKDLELIATAYHEAGHAVMAVSLGRPIEKVTIAPSRSPIGAMTTGLRLGTCKIQKGRTKPTKDWLEDEVMILYAGMVAESGFDKLHLSAIEMVAKELLEKKTISGRAVEHFFKMAQQQAQ